MLFNSNEFLVFFVPFCIAYFLTKQHLFLRNLLIVIASYIFYGSWDYRFAGLLLFTSVIDFTLARAIDGARSPVHRRAFLASSITLNVGVLVIFKYFDFFRESFESLLNAIGVNAHWAGWQVVLPVGLSFYTFQSMGYVVDVYRRQIPANRNLLQFMAYVSFFPQLVAGPIERGAHMLPQFARTLQITAADLELGVWLILWGMFKKVVLADSLAPLVEMVYHHATTSGLAVLLGTIAFGLQIYCDFSGYSDIARGVARLLGFELMVNFNLPYFSVSLRDFWSRWHISLSTWVRDYLYFPLGGSRHGESRTYLNLLITMLICGLWHGAALSFVLWGLWHGIGLMANHWWIRHSAGRRQLPVWIGWPGTMLFVFYGWMLFRAESFEQILQFTSAMTNVSLPAWWRPYLSDLIMLAAPLIAIEGWQWRSGKLTRPIALSRWPRAILQGAMLLAIIAFWETEASPFIYFQF